MYAFFLKILNFFFIFEIFFIRHSLVNMGSFFFFTELRSDYGQKNFFIATGKLHKKKDVGDWPIHSF